MKIILALLFTVLLNTSPHALADNKTPEPAFEVIVLGDRGGIKDGNLSAFLLRSLTEANYIALDAGTLVNGIEVALQNHAFDHLPRYESQGWSPAGVILRHHIKAYLLSHAHLDHVSGMLIASPQDSTKSIYALPSVNTMIGDTYFNGKAWANFSDRGIPPLLNKYHVVDLPPGKLVAIADTKLKVRAFSLSHPIESTAFVIEHGNDLFVYFGDTGPDIVEKEGKLDAIWSYLAKQKHLKRLRGIIIETSFENSRPHNLLFGHLTPELLLQELNNFAKKIAGEAPLKNFKVIISHVKYSLKQQQDPKNLIKQQLDKANNLGVEFIMATQGQRILL